LRKQSLAKNAQGSVDAIRGAVLAVPGVIDCYAVDNGTNLPWTIGGVTLDPHSVYVAVVGGASAAVAQAIWTKKATGCSYNGNTTVPVFDPVLGATGPVYNVTYEIPTDTPIFFAVTLKANPKMSTNINTLVQDAIAAAFAGTDGGPAAQIGGTVYASRFYAGVAATDPSCEIVGIQVGFNADTAYSNYLPVNLDQFPVVSPADIVVTQV
jgi:hypothetical protein